jgi:hypothetical protein
MELWEVMKTRGVKILDPVLESSQLDWMVVGVEECPDAEAEQRIVAIHFRIPHQPWGSDRTFVDPVTIHRSRRRVLFCQESGETIEVSAISSTAVPV